MFIQNEKDLEDYICEHIEDFKKFLKNRVFEHDDQIQNINFIGRQVNVAGNFIDLLFDSWDNGDNHPEGLKNRTFIVVELKYRELIVKDLAQLSRYLNILDAFYPENCSYEVSPAIGVLVGLKLDSNMQEIEICLNGLNSLPRIYFAEINMDITYRMAHYSFKDEFIDSLKFDQRITEIKLDSD